MIIRSSNKLRLKALVTTIEPIDGGVPAMTRWICNELEDLGIIPILAWYAPLSNYPSLSVPSYKLYQGKKPGFIKKLGLEKYEGYGIGCWLPELEFTHYLPGRQWEKLIKICDIHLAVSGNILSGLAYFKTKTPFLGWIATPLEADRQNRIDKLIPARRILDSILNRPILAELEKRIVSSPKSHIMCLSHYTAKELGKLSRPQKIAKLDKILYMPVDTSTFRIDHSRVIPWRIGFSGRYSDPRKNIDLLFAATNILLGRSYNVEVILVGDRKANSIRDMIYSYGLTDKVKLLMHLQPSELANLLQTFDVFTIPSHQEGLCIAALEAMACGIPIVSTKCGGPEDYVTSGITGEIAEHCPVDFANKIESICLDRRRRDNLSVSAINWVENHASKNASSSIFTTCLSDYMKHVGIPLFEIH
jgi:glycosyltransferase involved in cell wall biosynthesis